MKQEEIHSDCRGRCRRWPFFVLLLLLLLITANHMEYHWRLQRLQQDSGFAPVVRIETNPLGHTFIGIEEKIQSGEGSTVLHFALLEQWVYTPQLPPPCPSGLSKLNDKEVTCVGFMYPLEEGNSIKTFCLMRTTQTCCYGPRPQYNQYLLVEMKTPVKFERMAPVAVKGKFIIDPQPSQGYIYRIEGSKVVSAADEAPDENPAVVAARTRLPLFDFAALSTVESSQKLTAELLALDRRTVLVAGYFSGRDDSSTPPQLMISSKSWNSQTPTVYNTVPVYPKNKAQMPPLWKDQGIMQGILHVEKNAELWPQNGIVALQEAVRINAGGIKIDTGPLLGFWEEMLLLAACLYWAFRKRERSINKTTNPELP